MSELANRYDEISQLIFGSLEGTLDAAQAARLQSLITTQEWALKYYCEYITLYSDLKIPRDISVFSSSRESVLDPGLWERLGEEEKKAEAVTIPAGEDETQEKEITKIRAKEAPRKINKVSLYTAFLAVAALVTMFVYVYLNPRKSLEAATLADSIDAQWTSWLPLNKNARLTIDPEPIKLQRGIIKLVTDEGVQVLIESPAEFRFVSTSQIVMNQGRLFATVSQTGRGFTVQTANSKVTDLGTEFGVLADSQGTTELHVFKGKTIFIGETKNKVKTVLEALGGHALRLEQQSDSVKNIELNDNGFVRSIDSQANLVWRGQNLDAANLIAGGNGIADGPYFKRIDPLTGKYSSEDQLNGPNSRSASNDFKTVSSLGVVDGVAVPSGQTKITTQGNSFNCAKTSKTFTWNIIAFNNAHNESAKDFAAPVFHHGQKCGDKDSPALLLHSNILITLDLEKIRGLLPENTIKHFKAWGGITEAVAKRPDKAKVDFFVLIDGKVRYEKTDLTVTDGVINIDIAINQGDRFLTFIVTEGNEDPNAWYPPLSNDFFYLINPEFVL